MRDGSTQRLLLPEQAGQEEQRRADHSHVVQIDRVGKDVDRKDQVGQRTPERELAAGAKLIQRTFGGNQFVPLDPDRTLQAGRPGCEAAGPGYLFPLG